MYPQRELSRLAARKVALHRDIVIQRFRCAQDASRVAQPLDWLDRVLAFWQRLSPIARYAVVPLGFLVKRALFARRRKLRAVARWGPLVLGLVRMLRSAIKPGPARAGRRRTSPEASASLR